MQETALVESIFEEANFQNAEFAMCSIVGSNFIRAIFNNTSFLECECRDSTWRDGSIIDDSIL